MSQLDGITLLCEGVDGGRDVRLLEAARLALEQTIPLARVVGLRPAGSKLDLRPAIRAHRSLRAGLRVFAVERAR